MEFSGARALVTGASSGIGAATAQALAAREVRVVVTGRDAGRLAVVAERVGGEAVVADLADPHGVRSLAAAVQAGGALDIVVHCAGVGLATAADRPTDAELDEVITVNLRAPIALTRELLPSLRGSPSGALVFVGSIAGRLGVPLESSYAATKAGLARYAESLRLELDGSGIAVTVVTPGVVETPFFSRRGVPYPRRFPRPVSADRVAADLVRAVEKGRAEVVIPRWLRVPVLVHDLAPTTYSRLAGRWG